MPVYQSKTYLLPPAIGLIGLAGSGKSVVANHLCLNYGYFRHPFAGPLKDMLKILGLTDEELHDKNAKMQASEVLGGLTPRYAMQTLGTEWGRKLIHPDIWVDAWLRSHRGFSHIVADDVRFDNEIAAIKKLKGKVVRITTPNSASSGDPSFEHSSEDLAKNESLVVDYTIHNEMKSLPALFTEVATMIAAFEAEGQIKVG